MSSNLISLPFRPVLNNRGTFESGAKLTVYKADSATLEPIFADEDLTVNLSNPLEADGYGVFPAVYYDSAQPIRVLVQEASGTTLFNLDPYVSTVFDAQAILDQASLLNADSAAEALKAKASADAAALSEAVVEGLVGPTYDSPAEGIASTVSGDFFAVAAGDVIEIYLNDAGIAVLQRSLLSSSAVETALAEKAALVHTHNISSVTGLQTILDAKAPLANPALTGTATVNGVEIGFRNIPRRTTSGTAVVGDRAGCVAVTSGFTIPASVFSAGDAVSLYNDSASPVTVTQGAGLTLRLAGSSTTGNRTLAARGLCTIWFNSATEAIISGPGLT